MTTFIFAEKENIALSVRYSGGKPVTDSSIKHYKIRKTNDGKNVFIMPKRPFSSIDELIEYYKGDQFFSSTKISHLLK